MKRFFSPLFPLERSLLGSGCDMEVCSMIQQLVAACSYNLCNLCNLCCSFEVVTLFTLFATNTSFPVFVFPFEGSAWGVSTWRKRALWISSWHGSPCCLCFSNLPNLVGNHQYHLILCQLAWCCHLKEACSMIQLAAWWNRFTYVRLLQPSQLLQTRKCQIKNNFATPALRFLSNK